jgi:hypothetical protein
MTIAIAAGWRRLAFDRSWLAVLDEARERHRITKIWHGGARGGDEIVALWATARRLEVEAFPAPWDLCKEAKIPVKAAGEIRVRDMLDGKRGYVIEDGKLVTTEQVEGTPELLLAMPGYKGTRGTIRAAEARRLEVQRLAVEPWVINRWHYRRKDGSFDLPPGSIDIQRGTALGNPYVVGEPHPHPSRGGSAITGDECLELYRAWLWWRIGEKDRGVLNMFRTIGGPEVIARGGGHPHIVCTCKRPDGSGFCHGDVVVRAWRWLNRRPQPDAPTPHMEAPGDVMPGLGSNGGGRVEHGEAAAEGHSSR